MRVIAALLVFLAASACGSKPLSEQMVGTYGSSAVQAELEEHEREFFGDDLHARFDSVDKAEAAESGEVWARLRLRKDGGFDYEGPLETDGDALRFGGRWTARPGFVDLVPARRADSDLPAKISWPASPKHVEVTGVSDPRTRRPLRLERR